MIDAIQKFALAGFTLPDGKLVLQRRTKDAPYAPGKLGFFGGWVENDETVEECLLREIQEETSLNVKALEPILLTDFIVPVGIDFDMERHYYLFIVSIKNAEFEVYEGDNKEAYALKELKEHNDVAGAALYTLEKLEAAIKSS